MLVVKLDAAVVEEAGEPVPVVQAVADGVCDLGLPRDTRELLLEPRPERRDKRLATLLPYRTPLVGAAATDGRFDRINVRVRPKGRPGKLQRTEGAWPREPISRFVAAGANDRSRNGQSRSDRGAQAPQTRSDNKGSATEIPSSSPLLATRSPALNKNNPEASSRSSRSRGGARLTLAVARAADQNLPREKSYRRYDEPLVQHIRCIDHLADTRGEREERHDVVPGPAPGRPIAG